MTGLNNGNRDQHLTFGYPLACPGHWRPPLLGISLRLPSLYSGITYPTAACTFLLEAEQ